MALMMAAKYGDNVSAGVRDYLLKSGSIEVREVGSFLLGIKANLKDDFENLARQIIKQVGEEKRDREVWSPAQEARQMADTR